jgi:peptidoglycan biosynthesis protein MviN/MurJ (putative lipid II flippase)
MSDKPIASHVEQPPRSPDARTGRSLAWRILRAAFVVGIAHVFVKLFGIIQARALAHYFGATAVTDMYLFVFDGIIMTLFLVGEEIVGPAFLPVFKEHLDKDEESQGWAVASAVMQVMLLFLLLAIGLMIAFPEAPVRFFAWMSGKEISPGRVALSSRFLQGMAPALLGISIGSLTYIILNGYTRFFWAAFGDASLKIVVIVSILVGGATAVSNIRELTPQQAGAWQRARSDLHVDSPDELLRAGADVQALGVTAAQADALVAAGWLESVAQEYHTTDADADLSTAPLMDAAAAQTDDGFAGRWLVLGVLLAGFAKLLTHLAALGAKLRHIHWRGVLRSPAFKTVLILAAPLIIGVFVARARDLINNYGVLIPLEDQGIATANNFGRKIFTSLGWLIPYAVSIAMFPYFCEMVDRKDDKAMGRFLDQSYALTMFFFLPIAAVVAVCSLPIARLLFESGRFSLEDAKLAAVANAIYTLVLPAYALEYLYMQAFFSKRRMIAITIIGIVFSTLSIAVSLVAVRVFGLGGVYAIAAVAAGYVISRMLKTVVLGSYLRRFVPHLQDGVLLGETAKILVLTVLCAAASYGAMRGAGALFPDDLSAKEVAAAEATEAESNGASNDGAGPDAGEAAPEASMVMVVHQMATAEGAQQAAAALRPDGAQPLSDAAGWELTDVGGQQRRGVARGFFYIETRADDRLPPEEESPRRRGMLKVVLPQLAAAGAAATIVFLLTSWLLGMSELRTMVDFGKSFLRRRRQKSSDATC